MTPSDFEFLSDLVRRRSGIVLGPDKTYLLESRLVPVARRNGIEGLDGLVRALRAAPSGPLAEATVEAMTTNESFFFRDKTPFDLFENVMLPELTVSRAAQKKLRIWCAAASTGQEPYSLAMMLKEREAGLAGWRYDILGTDIANGVLDKARAGVYTQFEVQRGLPIQMMVKYFEKTGDLWKLKDPIRAMVRYEARNLLDGFSGLGTFDIVFCRNVLIYFDRDTKRDILERIAKLMPADGYLVLGAAETVLGITDAFRPVPGQRGLYAPAAAPATAAAAAAV